MIHTDRMGEIRTLANEHQNFRKSEILLGYEKENLDKKYMKYVTIFVIQDICIHYL